MSLCWKVAFVCAFGALANVGVGCGGLRSGPREAPSDGGSPPPAQETATGSVAGDQRLKMEQVPDLPRVDYRAVYAVRRDRVFAVGDEALIEWDGHVWMKTTMGGVDFSGVWGTGTFALAVGTTKNTNRGVVMIRTPTSWVQFATVEHGLRAVWGTGDGENDRVVLVGNDGATYYGNTVRPMAQATLQNFTEDVPVTMSQTLFFPILTAVGGNSVDHIVAAGPAATIYSYDGQQWFAEHQNVDLTRSFTAAWGRPGRAFDVIVGGNYYGLWSFTGGKKNAQTGEPAQMKMLNEERDDVQRGAQFIYGIWGENTNEFLAVGSTGRVMLFDGTEHPHIFVTPAGARDLRGISGTAWDDLWIVGSDGVFMHGALAPQ